MGFLDTWQVSHLQLSSRVHSLCGLLEGGCAVPHQPLGVISVESSHIYFWKSNAEITIQQVGVMEIAKFAKVLVRFLGTKHLH